MELFAPAKINLRLEIKGRREDGFHEIETLMVPISLSDRLIIERDTGSETVNFTCDDPSLPKGDDNLVVRAARLFMTTAKMPCGVKIILEKKIPHGAGLGGGSSDAATTLLGLNELFRATLSTATLLELAAQIGSDVPFFILQRAAVCRGRGEVVTPATLPGEFKLLLVKPEFGVPTSWAYRRWKESRELPDVRYEAQEFGVQFFNHLERPVFEKYVFLARLKMWLLQQVEVGAALLSGSGSAVVAALRNSADARLLAERIRSELDPRLWTCECRTIS
jgi:4-diphosphocytidyl-2-C-methyl-D-erythritol kinase